LIERRQIAFKLRNTGSDRGIGNTVCKCNDVVLEFTKRGVTQNGSSTQKEEGGWREEGYAPAEPTEEGDGQEGDATAPPPQEEDGLAEIRFDGSTFFRKVTRPRPASAGRGFLRSGAR
jgi:hypothetical protein